MMLGLLAVFLVSCDNNDDYVGDGDTYSVISDATGTFNNGNNYTLIADIDINSSDVVLVYRNINSNTNNPAVWQLLPKTEYLTGGRELDYNFLFNTSKIEIFTESNFDQSTMTASEANQYLNNQTFRMVLVPASFGKNANVKYEDYESVIKFYNIDDSKVRKL